MLIIYRLLAKQKMSEQLTGNQATITHSEAPTPDEMMTRWEANEERNTAERIDSLSDAAASDSFLVPAIAAERGIIFTNAINHGLLGETQGNSFGAGGLARATIELGETINGRRDRLSIFDNRCWRSEERTLQDKDGEYTEDFWVPPHVAGLGDTPYAGEAGSLFLRMVEDTVNPYEPQSGDGYTVLSARQPADAYKARRWTNNEEDVAHLCSNSEAHFANALNAHGKLTEVTVNGEVVALQKRNGDHTAILTQPAVLNGVRLPVGSIMTVEHNEESQPKFGFGRLSAYCFGEAETGRREFATVFRYEADQLNKRHNNYDEALRTFNKIVGRESSTNAEDLLNAYISENTSDLQTAETALRGMVAREIAENRVARMLQRTQAMGRAYATVAVDEEAKLKANNFDPKTYERKRDGLRDKLVETRLMIARTFGQEAIVRARTLCDMQTTLARYSARRK